MHVDIAAYLRAHRQDIADTICRIVGIPSTTGNEMAAQHFMRELYASLGLDALLLDVDIERLRAHAAFVPSQWGYERRPNAVGILRGSPSGRSIILNGHIDVVSAEPVSEWTSPPWEGRLIGNRLFGRGACDTKGGLVASFYALKTLLDLHIRPKSTVILESVIDEEVLAGGGTLACLVQGLTADGMVVIEPNRDFVLTLAHAGILFFRVTVMGLPVHAGLSQLGVNAIGKLNVIYDALMALDAFRATSIHDPIFETDYPRSCHLNVGTYRAGDSIGTVAGWAEMECRMSYVPDEKREDVVAQVEEAVASATKQDEWLTKHPPIIKWIERGAIAWKQDAEHPFALALRTAMERVTGPHVKVIGVPWGMDTRFAHLFGIPAATIGPTGRNFHGVDEYVELDSVLQCAEVLALVIADWCGTCE